MIVLPHHVPHGLDDREERVLMMNDDLLNIGVIPPPAHVLDGLLGGEGANRSIVYSQCPSKDSSIS